MALRGDRESEKIIKNVAYNHILPKLMDEFKMNIFACGLIHEQYKLQLEDLKEAFWGDYLGFINALAFHNKAYERAYKDARQSRESFVKIKNNNVRIMNKCDLGAEEIMPSDVKFELMYEEGEEPVKTAAGMRDEILEFYSDAETMMDNGLAMVRQYMRDDFALGEIAKSVISVSKESERGWDYADRGE